MTVTYTITVVDMAERYFSHLGFRGADLTCHVDRLLRSIFTGQPLSLPVTTHDNSQVSQRYQITLQDLVAAYLATESNAESTAPQHILAHALVRESQFRAEVDAMLATLRVTVLPPWKNPQDPAPAAAGKPPEMVTLDTIVRFVLERERPSFGFQTGTFLHDVVTNFLDSDTRQACTRIVRGDMPHPSATHPWRPQRWYERLALEGLLYSYFVHSRFPQPASTKSDIGHMFQRVPRQAAPVGNELSVGQMLRSISFQRTVAHPPQPSPSRSRPLVVLSRTRI